MSKITLYHYTSENGAAGIKKERMIRGSTLQTPAQNRRHGTGVYFTSVPPSQNPKSILLNNYDDRGCVVNSRKLWDRLRWVVEVVFPVHEVEKITGVKNQDIYLYRGDVDLQRYQHRIYKNPHPALD